MLLPADEIFMENNCYSKLECLLINLNVAQLHFVPAFWKEHLKVSKNWNNVWQNNKVAWPSGLRRWFKAPVSSEAWVQIPPLPKTFSSFSVLSYLFKALFYSKPRFWVVIKKYIANICSNLFSELKTQILMRLETGICFTPSEAQICFDLVITFCCYIFSIVHKVHVL